MAVFRRADVTRCVWDGSASDLVPSVAPRAGRLDVYAGVRSTVDGASIHLAGPRVPLERLIPHRIAEGFLGQSRPGSAGLGVRGGGNRGEVGGGGGGGALPRGRGGG